MKKKEERRKVIPCLDQENSCPKSLHVRCTHTDTISYQIFLKNRKIKNKKNMRITL